MRHITGVLALAFASLALVAAGCGSDDTTSTDSGTSGATGASGAPLTQEEWVAQADAICKQADQDIEQQASDLFGGQQPSPAEVEQFANDVLIPSLREQAADIRALTPPEDSQAEINQLVDDLDGATDEVEQDPSLLQASNSATAFADVNQEAQDLGLQKCGNG